MNRVYELDIYCYPRGNGHKRTFSLPRGQRYANVALAQDYWLYGCIDFDKSRLSVFLVVM